MSMKSNLVLFGGAVAVGLGTAMAGDRGRTMIRGLSGQPSDHADNAGRLAVSAGKAISEVRGKLAKGQCSQGALQQLLRASESHGMSIAEDRHSGGMRTADVDRMLSNNAQALAKTRKDWVQCVLDRSQR